MIELKVVGGDRQWYTQLQHLKASFYIFLQELSRQSDMQESGLAFASGSCARIDSWQVSVRYMFNCGYLARPIFSHAMTAMVGDRLVSVGGWEGGATMRSVPVTVKARAIFNLKQSSSVISGCSLQFEDSFSSFNGLLLRIRFSRRLALFSVS